MTKGRFKQEIYERKPFYRSTPSSARTVRRTGRQAVTRKIKQTVSISAVTTQTARKAHAAHQLMTQVTKSRHALKVAGRTLQAIAVAVKDLIKTPASVDVSVWLS